MLLRDIEYVVVKVVTLPKCVANLDFLMYFEKVKDCKFSKTTALLSFRKRSRLVSTRTPLSLISEGSYTERSFVKIIRMNDDGPYS